METMIPRLLQPLQQSHFLFGPRGSGKSTFLKATYPNALWIDLLQPDVFRTMTAHPERVRELVYGNPDKKTIVIDEVQKVPQILSVVHALIEEKTGLQFVLTGSSARKLKHADTDLLAGRVLWKTMHPFLLAEIGSSRSLEQILQYGLLPIIYSSHSPAETLEAYVDLYIREEVQQESLTRNMGNFSRFLEAASFSHATLLNITNIARECSVERKVVESYISILYDILLAFQIPVFAKKAKRALITHCKFFFFDTGVFRTLRPAGPLDMPEEISGAALEGLVAQHLRAWNAYAGAPYELYFWRTRNGVEVDFVLYGASGLTAIEVKNTAVIRTHDLRGLIAFKSDYPNCKPILLYRGKDKLLINGIQCIPCESFLQQLDPSNQDILW